MRDRKRPTYNGFLQWLDSRPAGACPALDFGDSKEALLPLLFERLKASDFQGTYERAQASFDAWKLARTRFNGEMVRELTGLDGKALAGVMTQVRARMGSNPAQVQQWVLSHSDDELCGLVRQVASELQATGA